MDYAPEDLDINKTLNVNLINLKRCARNVQNIDFRLKYEKKRLNWNLGMCNKPQNQIYSRSRIGLRDIKSQSESRVYSPASPKNPNILKWDDDESYYESSEDTDDMNNYPPNTRNLLNDLKQRGRLPKNLEFLAKAQPKRRKIRKNYSFMKISSRKSSSASSASQVETDAKGNLLLNTKDGKKGNQSDINKNKISCRAFGRTFYPFRKEKPNLPKISSPLMSPKDYFFNALRTREFKQEQNRNPLISFGKTYHPRKKIKKKKDVFHRINLNNNLKNKITCKKFNIEMNRTGNKGININTSKNKDVKSRGNTRKKDRKKYMRGVKSVSPFALQLSRKDITDGYPVPHEERFNNKCRVHQKLY
ncbi:unnamed protein product [Moneuplotes crassus]|uniref:Uncharacterized protein n=1 Tax=Euplotes crassus TaxID=5936 RepID=A0AAD1UEU6_EUPCR|nr:unnamed protein product [Moneuplotes crassus]